MYNGDYSAGSTSSYGSYYTYVTASAGEFKSKSSGTLTSDLCQHNWQLPTGGSSGQFQTLANAYGYSSNVDGNFIKNVFMMALAGRYVNSALTTPGSYCYLWSRNIEDSNRAFGFEIENANSGLPYDSDPSVGGRSARCVAK